MKIIRRTITKAIIFTIILIASCELSNSITPIFNNAVAIQTLNGGDAEFVNQQIFNSIKNYFYIPIITLFILMFKSEINLIVSKLKGDKK